MLKHNKIKTMFFSATVIKMLYKHMNLQLVTQRDLKQDATLINSITIHNQCKHSTEAFRTSYNTQWSNK